MARKKSNSSQQWRRLAAVVALAIVVVAALELTNTTHFFHSSTPASQVVVTAGRISKQQPTVTKSGQSDKSISTNNSANKGTATDTGGQIIKTDSSQWITAASGDITVKQPAANGVIHDGSVLGGSAKVSMVQYRLIDNKLGVISEGQLNVSGGNFSGIMHFQPSASTGKLDVFSYDSDGTEINEMQIAVQFGS